jgi:protein disulfide-isomerase A1
MKWFAILSLFILVSVSVFAEESSDVVVLTDDNFESTISASDLILVEFYAPWCGHCKKLAPEYENAATLLKGKAVLAKLDATTESNAADKNDIRGYPTIKLFRKGKPTEYKGGRTSQNIVDFVEKYIGLAVTRLTSAEAKKFIESNKASAIGFFPNNNIEEYKTFVKVADNLRDTLVFGEVFDTDTINEYEVKVPVVVIFKAGEDNTIYEGPFEESKLMEWLETYSVPLVVEISQESYQKFMQKGLPLVIGFYDPDNKEQTSLFFKVLTVVAKKFQTKLSFSSGDGKMYKQQVLRMGLKADNFPSLALTELNEGTNYPLSQDKELTIDAVSEFLQQFLDSKLEPFLKSDPIPENNDAPVKEVVGKSFADIVLDPKKNVLLEFYAPWCGHCKKLAPVYDELGLIFKDQSDVVIAKMDATTNDPPKGHNIQGFPTIKFFPTNNKAGVLYDGDRSLESLKKFVENNKSGLSTEALKEEVKQVS